MNEVDEVVEGLRLIIVGRRPPDGQGAVIDAVEKHAGDDLESLVLEVRYKDSRTGEKHSECYDDLVRIMSSSPGAEIQWLADFIVIDLDEILLARD